MLDDNAGLKLEEILEYIFEWSYKDARHEEIKELKEKIEKAEGRENSQKDALKEKETEWKQKELQYMEKLSKQKDQHQGQMETLKKSTKRRWQCWKSNWNFSGVKIWICSVPNGG